MTPEQRIDLKARIEFCGVQIKQRELYAQWWIAYANTKANKSRRVVRGDDYVFTEDDLVEDAFNTAKRHIELMEEFAGTRDTMIRQLGE